MQICAFLLGLVMLASARKGRPFPPDETFSSECDCEELRLQIKQFLRLQEERITNELLEAMQLQDQKAELRNQEVLRQQEKMATTLTEGLRLQEQRTSTALTDALGLQEQKTASALQEVVRQMEHLLRKRDEATLQHTLDERLQRMEEGARALGKPSTPSPEREDAAAAGGLATLQQLERRVSGLEAACSRLLPLSTPQAPPATPSSPASPSPSSSTALTTSSSLPTAAPAPPSASAPSAHDQPTERMQVMERIKEARARLERARAQPSSLGETLRNASRDGSLHDVQRLLDEGADANYTSSFLGYSPLMSAATSSSHSSPDVVALLQRRGADVSAVDVYGRSALYFAAAHGHVPVVSLLLGAGAPVDARRDTGTTPLHVAALNGEEATVRALLAGGARKDLKGWSGRSENKTPFDVATTDAVRNLLRT